MSLTVQLQIKYYSMIRFDPEADVSNTNVIKSSVQRAIISQLTEQFPNISHCINDIIPDKKAGLKIAKW